MNDKMLRKYMLQDMSLLLPLYVLLEEKHVSKSADRLDISQPSMSQYLSKIRRAFNDDILVRQGNKMLLTPTAERMKPELEAIISAIDNMHNLGNFDPKDITRKFVLASVDIDGKVSNLFLNWAQQHSPDFQLEIRERNHYIFDELEAGKVDFAIGDLYGIPENFHSRKIVSLRYGLFDSIDDPVLAKGHNSIEAIARGKFSALSGIGMAERHIDKMFKDAGFERSVAFETHSLHQVREAVKNHKILAFLPLSFAADQPVYQVDCALDFEVDIHLVWHPKMQNDRQHSWMRNQIYDLASNFGPSFH